MATHGSEANLRRWDGGRAPVPNLLPRVRGDCVTGHPAAAGARSSPVGRRRSRLSSPFPFPIPILSLAVRVRGARGALGARGRAVARMTQAAPEEPAALGLAPLRRRVALREAPGEVAPAVHE